jgi:tetratricopeptide (TPR) repeat protein
VFWVHASDPARFEEGYRKIAERVKPPGWNDPKANMLRLVCNWLSDEGSGKWSMVVDNADDSTIFIAPSKARSSSAARNAAEWKSECLSEFLPLSSNGSILVTSRSREVALVLTGAEDDIITVGPMDESHANALFRKKLGSGCDEQQISELLQELDYMPLAISQAAAYIRQRAPRTSVTKYLSNFYRGEKDRAALLETDLRDPRRDQSASNSIIITWRMSFEHIREQRPSAARLLSLMSFFDRQGIPEFMLHDWSDEPDEIDHEFEDDISTLRSYLLISLNLDGDMFSMHRLVQFSTLKWLESNGEAEKWKEKYIDKIDHAWRNIVQADLTKSRAWFPHAEIALSYRPTSPEYLAKWTEVMVQASWYAETQGKYPVAEEMAQKALKWRELSLGKENLATLGAAHQLATIRDLRGRCSEAEEMHRRVLYERMKALGENNLETLVSFHDLAVVLKHQGKYEEAEEAIGRALDGLERLLGREHPHYLSSMCNLASVLHNQGKYKEAEEINRQVLDKCLEVLGPNHPNTITSISNLALTLRDQKKYDEAEEMFTQAIERYEKTLGTDHPHTLQSVHSLASVLRLKKKYEEAEVMNKTALDGREKTLGKEHPSTLRSLQTMALLLECQEKHEAAEGMHRRAIEGMRKVLGERHPVTLDSITDLASMLRVQGKHEEADAIDSRVVNESD